MQNYVVGKVEDVQEGKSLTVQAGKRTISIFNIDGEFFAMNTTCPHKGASMCDGPIDKENKMVRCPWHLWNWSLETGCLEAHPEDKIPVYKTEVVNGEIHLFV